MIYTAHEINGYYETYKQVAVDAKLRYMPYGGMVARKRQLLFNVQLFQPYFYGANNRARR